MGNYRFKLSDMLPYAWFYKLKDMSRAGKSQSRSHHNPRTASHTNQKPFQTQREALLPGRASYYFSSRSDAEKPHGSPLHPKGSDTLFPQEPPRKPKKRSRRKPASPSANLLSSSVTSGCSRRIWQEQPVPPRDIGALIDAISSCKLTSSPNDIFIDVGSKSSSPRDFPSLRLQLPPIMTKPVKKETEHAKVDEKNACGKEQQRKNMARRSPPAGLHRLRMRASSPKLAAAKKLQAGRKSLSTKQGKKLEQSFAVVKSSSDPQKDFRDSMVEMILENDIRASKDLEELLACYLSLNSNEYHDVIVKVFQKIWFDLTDCKLPKLLVA